jgi:hypothetical protein
MENTKFKWIFESLDFCVGFKYPEYTKMNKTLFRDIMQAIYRHNEKSSLSLKCLDYFNANHSLEFVAQKFQERLLMNHLDYARYKKIKSTHKSIEKHCNIILKCIFSLTKTPRKGT